MDSTVCPHDGVPTVSSAVFEQEEVDKAVGMVFADRYRIDGVLGQGGMGRVYRANQLSMNRPVALKTLHANLLTEKRHMKRFYREARAASRLSSPHVVRIYDFGIDEAQGTPFIAMELLEGRELRKLLDDEAPLEPKRAARLAAQIVAALREAEKEGIVHRDLKPDNVFVTSPVADEEFVKVMDFGIAKILRSDSGSGVSALTATGATVGTPLYMAPEQILGNPVDIRADLYSLGCMLYEMLTGALHCDAEDSLQMMMARISNEAPDLPAKLATGEAPPAALAALYRALMNREPDKRPGDTEAVYKILSAVGRGDPVDAQAVIDASLRVGPDSDFALDSTLAGDAVLPVTQPGAAVPPTSPAAPASPLPATAERPASVTAVQPPAPTRAHLGWIAGAIGGAAITGLIVWALVRPPATAEDPPPAVANAPAEAPQPPALEPPPVPGAATPAVVATAPLLRSAEAGAPSSRRALELVATAPRPSPEKIERATAEAAAVKPPKAKKPPGSTRTGARKPDKTRRPPRTEGTVLDKAAGEVDKAAGEIDKAARRVRKAVPW